MIKNIADRLRKYDVNDIYQWPIDNAINKLINMNDGLVIESGLSVFEKTIRVRDFIRPRLHENNHGIYIIWIIKTWGQIKGISDNEAIKLIMDRAQRLENRRSPFNFNKIASWSKYFSFKDPERFAIYDARVIYSLNWLLLQCGAEQFFPPPEGRNSLMNAFDYSMLIFMKKVGYEAIKNRINDDINNRVPGARSRAMHELEQQCYLEKNLAYEKYCNLLLKISNELFPKDELALTKTEIILFTISDRDIVKEVMKELLKCYRFYPAQELTIQDETPSRSDNLVADDLLPAYVKDDVDVVDPVATTQLINKNNDEGIMAELLNNDQECLDWQVILDGISIYRVTENTVFVRINNINQNEFENALPELLKWLLHNGINKIVFEEGERLILPQWFLDALRENGIEIEFTNSPFLQDANENWVLWNHAFVGSKVPMAHNFTQSISFYHEFRAQNLGNFRRSDFIDWLVANKGFMHNAANAIAYPLGPNQLDILNKTDAEVGVIATQPAGIYARHYLERWRRCNVMNVLPRCLADVYIVGLISQFGLNGGAANLQIVNWGFAGAPGAAGAIRAVGGTLGRHFGLLDDNNQPTDYFYYYFG